jgi:hypothetical protein
VEYQYEIIINALIELNLIKFRKNNIFSYNFIMTKFSRTSTGKYMVSGKTYDSLIGTRAQVMHGTSYKTTGGLTKSHLMKNKSGRIVSKSKHFSAKKEKRLVKAGYLTKKGHFGFIKHGKSRKHKGGSNINHPLSPSAYDGKGVGTSGVDLQFVAGNAG